MRARRDCAGSAYFARDRRAGAAPVVVMGFSAASLRAVLDELTPADATGFVVALSGGADSASLLTALACPAAGSYRDLPVRALHVDHGLQASASDFRRGCERLCRDLNIPLEVIRVDVAIDTGESIEAAAREARYQALGARLQARECLLTAHHAEDQAETVLLTLFRGTGLKGLCAMPQRRAWAGGWHLRPLLRVRQRELRAFAAAANVASTFDPMNLDTRFDRVYLRELWPQIDRRWPGAVDAVGRAAAHCADAQSLLEQTAERTLERLRDGDSLSVRRLRALSVAERLHVLHHWITARAVLPPSTARLREALRQIIEADASKLPTITWAEHALRRYRGRVFLTAAHAPSIGEPRAWAVAHEAITLGETLGRLEWSPRAGGLDVERLPATVGVRRRRGGEALRPERRGRTQTLKHLCQAWGVLPWMRDALPLLYAGDALIAVGDLWTDADWCVPPGAPGIGCHWRNAPALL